MKITLNEHKRIVFIGKIPPPYYGVSIWFYTLKNADWPDSLDIKYLNNNINKELKSLGKINLSKIYKNFLLYLRYLILLIRFKPEIVVVPVSQTTIGYLKDSIYLILNKIVNSKTIIILHGSKIDIWQKESNIIIKKYFTYTLNYAYGSIVLGNKLKYLFKPYFSHSRIYVIPNGIDVNVIPAKNKNKKLELCYLGNLLPSKGIIKLIDALKFLDEIKEKIVLKVVGIWNDKKTKKYCIETVKNSRLPVTFLGEKTGKEKYEILSNCDIFIFTPIMPEGLPLVLIEAMAAGLPIITSNQGAISEIVIDGENGYIIDPVTPQKIAEKIRYLINNPEIRLKMGDKSRSLYEDHYTAKTMVKNYSDLFLSIN